ncbi:FMN-linked oxidoreductase [Pyrrhoderma noxium]|uniref:FMN-linked oxidoreductase n=1 Tax=Pyrrhoderma noxium TaxID=2282107 RepID=A0A286USW3_9AGAM|nr:FMN-linked oxidoreductase [Pyrrhoderma noxium]
MSRRASSSSPPSSPRPLKKQKMDTHLTSESFRNGVMLAPMVRSGALPTRLYALKHGAKLVWTPEIVDKAILHAERSVDPNTGIISYNGVTKAIFTTHPVEKPYLIYQIGSADPELAVKAAKTVQQDISGVDLNCGCPKPFSTHAGMGAALLSTPDLLCSILKALREAMPPEITVSAKIRLLPTQEETLKLVERIVNTGISTLTVHCRTRNMRPRERALIDRMREIVEFVEGMGKDVAVIENGDCVDRADAIRIRNITGAHSCMIATAAESNPTCFSPEPLSDLIKTFVPNYVRLGRYLDNHFSNTRFCAVTFKGANKELTKSERHKLHDKLSRAKSYDDLDEFVGGVWNGEEEMAEIKRIIESREENDPRYSLEPPPPKEVQEQLENELFEALPPGNTETETVTENQEEESETSTSTPTLTSTTTPPDRENPEPVTQNAPLLPVNDRLELLSGLDTPTPAPTTQSKVLSNK